MYNFSSFECSNESHDSQKRQVLNITVSGKGEISNEKIYSIDSLSLTPGYWFFFSKDEFYSTLKAKAVSDKEYENSEKLYTLFKMRDLSDLNDFFIIMKGVLLLRL